MPRMRMPPNLHMLSKRAIPTDATAKIEPTYTITKNA